MSEQYISSPLGLLKLTASSGKLRSLQLTSEQGTVCPDETTQLAKKELDAYFCGKGKEFTVELAPEGTAFQQAVWAAMAQIPYGKVATYGQLAKAVGRPKACRAVANAVGRNPLLILLPCHRVVSSRGLGGFSAGLPAKRRLLALETIEIKEKTVISEKFLFTFG